MAIATPSRRKRGPEDEDFYPSSDGKPMAETDQHRQLMIYFIVALRIRFADREDVYISGNNFIFYEAGDPTKRISPDCYVVFEVANRLRNSYKLWEEGGRAPNVVFEFTSRKTRKEDVQIKRPLYEQVLRVPEYFQFDPTGDYLKPRLQGFRLQGEQYVALPLENDRLYSEQLGLELVQIEEWVRLYDPVRGEYLLTAEELARKAQQEAQGRAAERQRAEQEAQRAQQEARRAEQEAQGRAAERQRADQEAQARAAEKERADAAETENARLRAELETLRRLR